MTQLLANIILGKKAFQCFRNMPSLGIARIVIRAVTNNNVMVWQHLQVCHLYAYKMQTLRGCM